MQSLDAWVLGLSVLQLYWLVASVSFVEGIFPVLPGDVVVAFLSFLAARGGGSWIPATLWICGGTIAGNSVVWWLGRRYGAKWLAHQMRRFKVVRSEEAAEATEHRIEVAYAKHGWVALLVARFVPGVRAFAPAAAGALRVPFAQAFLVLFLSSLIWYGAIAWLAFRVGSDWESVKASIELFAREAGLVGLVAALVLGIGAWWLWRRRKRSANPPA
jgi:membrane protein DedA with SNARE-associated domain